MSQESYKKECQRIRQSRESTEKMMREQAERNLFPGNKEHIINFARQMARDYSNQKADLGPYIKN